MQVLGLASSKVYDGVIQALPAKRAAYGSPNHKAADSTCGQTTSISKLCLSPKQQHAQPKPQDIYTWMVSPPLMRNLKSGAVSQGGVTEMPLAKALRAVLDNHLRSLTKGKVKDERPLKQVFEAYINAFGGALAECGAACMGMPASAPTPTTLNHVSEIRMSSTHGVHLDTQRSHREASMHLHVHMHSLALLHSGRYKPSPTSSNTPCCCSFTAALSLLLLFHFRRT